MPKARFGHGTRSIPPADYRYSPPKVKREPWIECHICGFDIPTSESVKHYKLGTLVCSQCADVWTHQDNMENLHIRDPQAPSKQKTNPNG